jgi:myo-inositol-1(or 4)-monophosphatase
VTSSDSSPTRLDEGVTARDLDRARALCDAVRAVAAAEVMPRYRKVAHSRKADGSILTEADVAAQAALFDRLRMIEPLPIVGEEMTPEAQESEWNAGDAGMWCVDPIDGTSNFVHGVPYFAVSVALMRRGRSVLGAIYAPVADEMFWAVRGHGAYLDDEPLPIRTEIPTMQGAFANVDFKRLPKSLGAALVANPPYYSQRNLGAATLEWCYLAAGRLDLYLHGGQKPWDYAAGCLILTEAGGSVGTLEGDDFWGGPGESRSVMAARDADLYAVWRDWVRRHR